MGFPRTFGSSRDAPSRSPPFGSSQSPPECTKTWVQQSSRQISGPQQNNIILATPTHFLQSNTILLYMHPRTAILRSSQRCRDFLLNSPRKSPVKLPSPQQPAELKAHRQLADSQKRISTLLLAPKGQSPTRTKLLSPTNDKDHSSSQRIIKNTQPPKSPPNSDWLAQLKKSPINYRLGSGGSPQKPQNRSSPRRPLPQSKLSPLMRQLSHGVITHRPLQRAQKLYNVKEVAESMIQTTEASTIEADLEFATNSLLRNSPHSPKNQARNYFHVFKKKKNTSIYDDAQTPRTTKQDMSPRLEQSDCDDPAVKTSPSNKHMDFRQTCFANNNLFLDNNCVDLEKRKRSLDQLMVNSINNEERETKLSDFSFGKCIGNGRFGQVYLARHKKNGVLVAIKKICKFTIRQYKMQKQIIQEIKLQAFCNNPNILQLYGFFHDELHIYLILEYAADGTLFNYLHKNSAKLPEKKVASIMKQVVYAVHFLHQNSIAHRDIKPQNILLSWGIAKLCDFGWSARVLQSRKSYCGTFDYTPPEILERKEYDESVDLWCLGVLLYELLTGTVPFSSSDKKASMNKIINVDKEKIVYQCEVSPLAKNLIESLLKKNPEQRLRPKQVLEHQFFSVLGKK